jgi:hypothetical protein
LFSQILKFIPRADFEGEVRQLNAQRHARGVSCWQQFVSMMFCQLGRAHSLREIEQGLKSCDRWAVELFFKALKQNLKIKTFVGTTANAVKIQVWTALIAMLMLRFMQLKSQWAWSLSNLVALLRMYLFTHRDLWTWLDNPLGVPPDPGAPQQVAMNF